MSMKLDGNTTVPARIIVSTSGTPVSNTNAVDTKIKDLLIAAFAAIPSQAAGTATVGAIVTALQTLP